MPLKALSPSLKTISFDLRCCKEISVWLIKKEQFLHSLKKNVYPNKKVAHKTLLSSDSKTWFFFLIQGSKKLGWKTGERERRKKEWKMISVLYTTPMQSKLKSVWSEFSSHLVRLNCKCLLSGANTGNKLNSSSEPTLCHLPSSVYAQQVPILLSLWLF